ncbi:MAG TPA: serine/threonine protein kinase, partial [Actinomycetota bacterium]
MGTSRRFIRTAFLCSILVATFGVPALTTAAASSTASAATTQNVLLVGNNWDGTVDVVNPKTFKKLGRINVAPDYQSCIEQPSPDQAAPCTINNELAAEGHPQLVDDIRVSPDGAVLYVSRPSMGDVAAFDLLTRQMLWRVDIGMRTDHLALSPDGRELLVSVTLDRVVDVIDTQQAAIVDQIPAGDFPHENEYSEDGGLIYDGSIGRVVTPDNPELDALKGDR